MKILRVPAFLGGIGLLVLVLAACASDSQVAVAPTPDVAAIIQQTLDAQPQGMAMTRDDVAQAVQQAMSAQPGVTEDQVASAIAKALAEQQPGVTQDQVASAIAGALGEQPGVTEDQVTTAIARALAERPGVTEAEVSDAITKALADRPGVTQEDIQMAVAEAVAMAMPAPVMDEPEMMMDYPDLLVRDVFFFATLTPPMGCSFWGCRVSFNMFDGLVAIDNTSANKEIRPNIAESWSVSEDGATYTFNIRDGVKFTTGRDVTAEAVDASFQRAFDIFEREGQAEGQAWYTLTEDIRAADDMTLEWKLTDAYAPLLPLLTSKDLLIVDAEEALANQETDEKGPDYGVKWATERSIGTGPFMVESFTAEQRLVMAHNPDYWGGHDGVQPSVDRVIDIHVPENSTAELQISAGEVDMGLQMDPVSLQGFQNNPDVNVYTYPSLITCNLLVDRRFEPITSAEGFQALRYAINYQGMRDIVAGGLADVHQSLILPGMAGHDPTIATKYYYNPELAKQLMASAGYPDGYDVDIQLRTGSCGSVPYQKALEYFQNDLKAVGINATIVQSTSSRFWGEIVDETYRDFGISGLGATYFDADQPATWRASRECNLLGLDDAHPDIAARLAELTTMGRVETNEMKRDAIYREMSELLVDNCGEITVLQVRDTVAHRTNISGIVPAAHAFTPEFRYIKKSE